MPGIFKMGLMLSLPLIPSLAEGLAAEPGPGVQGLPDGDGWRRALPGWKYEFPRDHFSHGDFKTEWWYVTGRLRTESGRRFGYQFTVFRRGLRVPADRSASDSRWVVNDLPLGHFALTDVEGGKFYYQQRLVRGAFGEAGFAAGARKGEDRLAWVGDWALRLEPGGNFQVAANQSGAALALKLEPAFPPVVHGADGVSQKSSGAGNASHYYSLTGLKTSGTITLNGTTEPVIGLSWLDREWATNQLAADQVGWDWLSLQLDDGGAVMLYQLRGKDGKPDEFSSGTLVDENGKATHLSSREFTLLPVPGSSWRSAKTGAVYPTAWRVDIPARQLSLVVGALLPDQELALDPVHYWEGAVDAAGTRAGSAVRAEGYLEMTGYGGELKALKE